MTQYVLCNEIVYRGTVYRIGKTIDDAQYDVGELTRAGAVLAALPLEAVPHLDYLRRTQQSGGRVLESSVHADTAAAIQGIQVVPTPPVPGQVLVVAPDGSYVPTNLTLDMLGPAFVIVSFGATAPVLEAGQTAVTPAFTASYSAVPDSVPNSVVLTDSVPSAPKDVSTTPTSFASAESFALPAYGSAVVFTLTAKKGAITKVATASIVALQRVYWGVGPAGGATEAFIKALTNSALAVVGTRAFTIVAGPGEKIYYAIPSIFEPVTMYVDSWEGGFMAPALTVPVTNAYGFLANYSLRETDNVNLGSTYVEAR